MGLAQPVTLIQVVVVERLLEISFGKGTGSSTMKCFTCSEPRHRQSECKKDGKRALFAETNEGDNNDIVIEELPVFNDE